MRAAVAASLDEDAADLAGTRTPSDAEELADTVLALVRDAGLEPGDEPWLGALALPDEDGELAPAGELVLPGSPFAQVIREGELAAVRRASWPSAGASSRWPPAGCWPTFALVRATDVVLDPDELEPRDSDFAEPDDAGLLDAVDVWCEDVLDRFPDTPVPPVATELVAVRDLDLVDDDRWPQALALLAQPPLRDALDPAGAGPAAGRHARARTAVHRLVAARTTRCSTAAARPVCARRAATRCCAGLYDEADATGFDDEQVLRALGVRTSVAALLDEPGGAAELLDRLADPDREVSGAQLHALYGGVGRPRPGTGHAARRVAGRGGRTRCGWSTRRTPWSSTPPTCCRSPAGVPLLPVRPARAAELAELFQVRRLSEIGDGRGDDGGRGARGTGVGTGPARPGDARSRTSSTRSSSRTASSWTGAATPDGVVHASTLEGVAAGLAWAAGQWPRRFEVAALLEDPSRTDGAGAGPLVRLIRLRGRDPYGGSLQGPPIWISVFHATFRNFRTTIPMRHGSERASQETPRSLGPRARLRAVRTDSVRDEHRRAPFLHLGKRMRIRATVAAVTGALALSAFAVPAAQAAPAAPDVTFTKVTVNNGKPLVARAAGTTSVPVTYTFKHTAGLDIGSDSLRDRSGPLRRRPPPTCRTRPPRSVTSRAPARPPRRPPPAARASIDLHAGGDEDFHAPEHRRAYVEGGRRRRHRRTDGVKVQSGLGTTQIKFHSKLTTDATPEPVRKGATITVKGTLTRANWNTGKYGGYVNAPVTLQFKKKGATTFTTVKTVKAGAAGALKTTVKASVDGTYRFAFAGSSTTAPINAVGDVIDVK